jgi:hypothetical protein
LILEDNLKDVSSFKPICFDKQEHGIKKKCVKQRV